MRAWIAFLRANGRLLSFGFTLNMGLALGQTYFLSLFNGDFQTALGLNHGQMATLFGAAMIVGSLGIAPAGRLLDTLDLRVFVAGVLLLSAASFALLAAATSVPVFFIALVGVRLLPGAVMMLCTMATMARYFDATRGRAAAVANMGFTAGYAIFPFIVTSLLNWVGWRMAWDIFAVAFVVAVLPLTMWQLRGHGDRHRKYLAHLESIGATKSTDAREHFSLAQVLRDGRFYMIIPGLLVVPCILFTFQYHQLTLVEEKHWDLHTFAALYLLFAATSFVANVVAGILVDRWGSRALTETYLWPMVPALALVAWVDGSWAIPFYMVCTATTFGLNLVTGVTVWSELYGTRHIGAIRGFQAMLNNLVASLGMVVFGVLIDRGVSLATQAVYSMALVIAAALLLHKVGSKLPRKQHR
jgi:predicted MFS family arabinose efflux permease